MYRVFFFQITHFQQRKVNDGKKRNPFDFFFLLKTDPNEGKSSVVGLRSVPDDMETKREATTSTTTTSTTTTTTTAAAATTTTTPKESQKKKETNDKDGRNKKTIVRNQR